MAAPMADRALKSLQMAALVDGIHTDVVCTSSENRIFITVTQFEKLGTLVHASRDIALEENSGIPTYTTKVMLGKDEPVTHVVARNLAERIDTHKPIIFAIALKNSSARVVRALNGLVQQCKVW